MPQEQDTHPRPGKSRLRTETEGKVICFYGAECTHATSPPHRSRFQFLSRKSPGWYLGAKVGAHKPPSLRRGFADYQAGSLQEDPPGLWASELGGQCHRVSRNDDTSEEIKE